MGDWTRPAPAGLWATLVEKVARQDGVTRPRHGYGQRHMYVDSTEPAPRVCGDLLSRRPPELNPKQVVCHCGIKVLVAWADDEEGPVGSRLTTFEPAADGRWMLDWDGAMQYGAEGTHLLHECGQIVEPPRPLLVPGADEYLRRAAR